MSVLLPHLATANRVLKPKKINSNFMEISNKPITSISIVGMIVAVLTDLTLRGVSVPPPVKPNIVFVLVDDWGFAGVFYHNLFSKTPNFYDLEVDGVCIQQHYNIMC